MKRYKSYISEDKSLERALQTDADKPKKKPTLSPTPWDKNEEAFDPNHPEVVAARKAHKAGTYDGNVDKNGNAIVHINGKPHTVTKGDPAAKNEGSCGTVNASKKPVSQMTPDEKKANDAKRKEYNEYQKSKRNEALDDYLANLEEGGLWDNIHAKRKRIKNGSGEKMKKPGSKGAPTDQDFKDASESTDGVRQPKHMDPKPTSIKSITTTKRNPTKIKPKAAANNRPGYVAGDEYIGEAQLDELSPETMMSYKQKADYSKDRAANSAAAKILRGKDKDGNRADHSPEVNTHRKRREGERLYNTRAADKLRKALGKKSAQQAVKKALKKESVDEGFSDWKIQHPTKSTKSYTVKARNTGEALKKGHAAAIKAGDMHKASDPRSIQAKHVSKNDKNLQANYESFKESLDESNVNDITAAYINENNITLDQLENMTEEELNELIGKAIGGAFKLGAKAVVGTARLAGGAAKGTAKLAGSAANRVSASGRADAAEKKADAAEKKAADRERITVAKQRVRDLKKKQRDAKNGTKPAASGTA